MSARGVPAAHSRCHKLQQRRDLCQKSLRRVREKNVVEMINCRIRPMSAVALTLRERKSVLASGYCPSSVLLKTG